MKAPFPWFGGKSRAADLVWSRLGDVSNYVEPFAGSLAVLLARPHEARIETVNDRDCYLANFWRALRENPCAVVEAADWPVNECDLHARHRWLVGRAKFRERMLREPVYFDAKVAGWWAWGISQWIGGGWCSRPEWTGRGQAGRAPRGLNTADARKPHLSSEMGVFANRDGLMKRPVLNRGGRGIASLKAANTLVAKQRPQLTNEMGVHVKRPKLTGNGSTGVHRKLPTIDRAGGRPLTRNDGLFDWLLELSARLRRVRVCCGDWKRVVTPSCTWKVGGGTLTGVLLDPPYAHSMRDRALYAIDQDISLQVRDWAMEAGKNPLMRIALCGLEGEHELPGWSQETWAAPRGYSKKARREVIWFSPHCVKLRSLFEELESL